ncbi:MAG: hypothetical protein JSU61_02335 [Fidelibacterota bacterium]|nr:MAG: hypothetical protein JSU61_02335 [Candidatus Neomarinimicrobiota bacterium]
MLRLYSSIFFVIIVHQFVFSQDARPTVAVIDFEGLGISQSEALVLTDRLRSSVSNTGAVRLVERSLMEEILAEQDFQLTGCTSDECVVEVGQILGVQFMIGGSIGKLGETYTIDARMISVETGASIRTQDVTYIGEVDGLIIEIEILAYEIMELDPTPELLDKRRLGAKEFLVQQAESIVRTRRGTWMRSLIFPGLGQIYCGKKVSGYGWLVSEIVLTGWIYFEYSKYQAAFDDYNRYRNLYEIETDHDKILAYKEKAQENHDELSSRNNSMIILSLVVGGLWVANVLHAYLTWPKRQPDRAYLAPSQIRLAYNPATRQTSLRLEFALE